MVNTLELNIFCVVLFAGKQNGLKPLVVAKKQLAQLNNAYSL